MNRPVWRYGLLVTALVLSGTQVGRGEVKPGDIITKDTITQAEELLTPSTRWMVERGMPMPIIATKKVQWPQAYQEATEKYARQVKLSADGRAIFDYVAGCPFPQLDLNDPLVAYKLMWNYEQKPYDNAGTEHLVELVNSKGEVERAYPSLIRRMMWTGRLYLDPKPAIAHNPPIHYTVLLGPVRLSDWNSQGAMTLSTRYLPPTVPDDYYLYDPAKRHVLSLSAVDRSDSAWGTDIDYDSYWGGFNGKLSAWTFRVLAEKDILAVVHSGKYGDHSVWCAPRDGTRGILAALPCVSWERRKVWVIEAVPTGYRRYAYSKRILYLDQDFFGLVVTDLYDQRGELWKTALACFFYTTKPYEGYPVHPIAGGHYNYEDEQPFLPNWVMIDVQQVHASTMDAPSGLAKPSEWSQEWYFNEGGPLNDPQVHTLAYLKTRQ